MQPVENTLRGLRRFSSGLQAVVLVLLALLPVISLAQAPLAADQSSDLEQQLLSQDVLLTFDELEWDLDTDSVIATGNVRITAGPLVFTCDLVEVAGDNLLESGNFLSAIGQEDSSPAKTGKRKASKRPGGLPFTLYIKADEVRLLATGAHITHARLSTCDKEHPHYSISARSLELDSDGTLTLNKIGLDLYGIRLLTYPHYSFNLGEGDGQGLALPKIGYSSSEGPSLYYDRSIALPGKGLFRLEPRYATKKGLGGKVGPWWELNPKLTVGVLATSNEPLGDGSGQTLWLSRRPEASVIWETTLASLDCTLTATSGQLVEQQEKTGDLVHRYRNYLGLKASPYRVAVGSDGRFAIRGAANKVWYSGGDSYSLYSLQAGLELATNATDVLEATLRRNWDSGITPFESDRLDIEQELVVGYTLEPRRTWGGRVIWTYDLDEGKMHDTQYELMRKQHCILYSLKYSTNSETFSLGLTLPGF